MASKPSRKIATELRKPLGSAVINVATIRGGPTRRKTGPERTSVIRRLSATHQRKYRQAFAVTRLSRDKDRLHEVITLATGKARVHHHVPLSAIDPASYRRVQTWMNANRPSHDPGQRAT